MRMGLNGLTVEAKSAIVVALGFSALPLTQCHMLWASFNIGALESWRNHAAARCTQFIYEVQNKSLSVIIDAWVEVVLKQSLVELLPDDTAPTRLDDTPYR